MRPSVLSKAFQAVNLFQRNSRGLTAKQLSSELNISIRSAYRYLEELAIHFPVVRDDAGPARYRLMERR